MVIRIIKRILNVFKEEFSKTEILTIEGLTIGNGSKIEGKIDIRKTGGKVSIGNDSYIFGLIATETEYSKVSIGNNVYIGNETIIDCVQNVIIEDDVLIAYQVIIQDSDNHSSKFSLRLNDAAEWVNRRYHNWEDTAKKPIRISRGAWISARVIILKGVTIGEGAIVGAGSVVTKNVPDWTVVAGNPARFIREIPSHER